MGEYIDNKFASQKVDEPCSQINENDTAELKMKIKDAEDEVNDFLRDLGYDGAIPLDSTDITDSFKLAVAYWAGSILYYSHSDPDAGSKMQKKAEKMLTRFYNTHKFVNVVKSTKSKPSTYRYIDKGNIDLVDTTDPTEIARRYGADD